MHTLQRVSEGRFRFLSRLRNFRAYGKLVRIIGKGTVLGVGG